MSILLPKKPPEPDPVAQRIQRRRREFGWTLEELARRAGLKARSYVHHIENGTRVPSEDVAVRIAEALGEDVEVFRAWARVRGGGTTDWSDAVDSARTLTDPSVGRSPPIPDMVLGLEGAPIYGLREEAEALDAPQARSSRMARMSLRNLWRHSADESPRIPLIAEGRNPGTARDPHNVEAHLRIDSALAESSPEVLRRFAELEHPFAYRLTRDNARRCPGLLPPGYYGVATREVLPLEADEAYVMRLRGGVELGYVRWDGVRLLLLPTAGQADFHVRDAPDEETLRARIVGRIALLVPVDGVEVG